MDCTTATNAAPPEGTKSSSAPQKRREISRLKRAERIPVALRFAPRTQRVLTIEQRHRIFVVEACARWPFEIVVRHKRDSSTSATTLPLVCGNLRTFLIRRERVTLLAAKVASNTGDFGQSRIRVQPRMRLVYPYSLSATGYEAKNSNCGNPSPRQSTTTLQHFHIDKLV